MRKTKLGSVLYQGRQPTLLNTTLKNTRKVKKNRIRAEFFLFFWGLYVMMELLAHSNSAINFIIYGVTHRGMREAYKKILPCFKMFKGNNQISSGAAASQTSSRKWCRPQIAITQTSIMLNFNQLYCTHLSIMQGRIPFHYPKINITLIRSFFEHILQKKEK